jgi:hypothetical protein
LVEELEVGCPEATLMLAPTPSAPEPVATETKAMIKQRAKLCRTGSGEFLKQGGVLTLEDEIVAFMASADEA